MNRFTAWNTDALPSMAGSAFPTGYDPMDGFKTAASWAPSTAPMDAGLSALPSLAAGSVASGPTGFWDTLKAKFDDSGFLGKTLPDGTKVQGWGGLALGGIGGAMNSWLGMQQLGVAKDTLDFNKRQYDQNYAAQRKTTNAELEDRQAARVAANPGAYQSVDNYMKKYGI